MPARHVTRPLKTLALALAVALSATSVHGASEDGTTPEAPKPPRSLLDIQIPIPHEPDVANNGCRLRNSPSEKETGALTEIPFWSLVEHDNLRYSVRLTVDGADKFAKRIAGLDEDARTLALLYALWDHLGHDGLVTFFHSDRAAAAAPQLRDALKQAGLTKEFDLFSRAMALVRAPEQSTRVDADKPKGFDHKLRALSREFGTRETFRKTITTFIEGRPALWQHIEELRARLNDPDRLTVLTYALADRIGDTWRPYPEVEKRLSSLSREQRMLALIARFNDEFKNGGVDQFFYNSDGALAPEVHDAMIELGMTEQAAIFRGGLDLFGRPYLRDTQKRREAFFHKKRGSEWDWTMSRLTDEFYALNGGLEFHQMKGSMMVVGGPGIDYAMIRYARAHKLAC
ncbi:MAG: DUF4375 domain-containing protein [Bradyrhizobium sp.]|uniref:DMP19 family protein n=1 Tax=Bradyrhizobium sp. TaxID=376 RepID=UPI0025C372F2|nr:DUF4375 domain-containing protein [Bradyrhizobium sp.]MBI5260985.1 DUF4375 domain-containing protein [Bradyrhizobium sp.]